MREETTTVFISADDKTFHTAEECAAHEVGLAIASMASDYCENITVKVVDTDLEGNKTVVDKKPEGKIRTRLVNEFIKVAEYLHTKGLLNSGGN